MDGRYTVFGTSTSLRWAMNCRRNGTRRQSGRTPHREGTVAHAAKYVCVGRAFLLVTETQFNNEQCWGGSARLYNLVGDKSSVNNLIKHRISRKDGWTRWRHIDGCCCKIQQKGPGGGRSINSSPGSKYCSTAHVTSRTKITIAFNRSKSFGSRKTPVLRI